MPNYKAHEQIAAIAAGLVTGGVFVGYQLTYRALEHYGIIPENTLLLQTGNTVIVSALIGAGTYFGGTLNSPDLDTPSTPYNKWGKLRYLWLPYQIAIKHRSPFSHWPILATVFKMGYFLFIINLIIDTVILMFNLWYVAIGVSVRIPLSIIDIFAFTTIPLRYPLVWVFIVGDVIGEAVHIITDRLDGLRRQQYRDESIPVLSDSQPDTPQDYEHPYG